jgi:hypothetical protein
MLGRFSGAIFLKPHTGRNDGEVLVANVSGGGRDCRTHNNNSRLDAQSARKWIDDTIRRIGARID